ncbi:hypothetical protein A8B81_08210 [Sulfitobacter pontiacus]|uniref:hypothetical protein n=1 Tax=Sulfitobacter pontiacus TaxID=60137 RepID=UPI0007D8D11C|nr:hypothetical protein [Sulfitobacter pontiacus]OAN82962.1 hypothetical protein A8B81_08210 [Sulfitobacter pontiacus]
MSQSDPWKALFDDWAKRGSPIPENEAVDDRPLWEGMRDAYRFKGEVEALEGFEDFERELYGGLELWQHQLAINGEIGVEKIVFEYLKTPTSDANSRVWPSLVQVETMRHGLAKVDRLAIAGELDAYQVNLRKHLYGSLNVENIEAEKRWVMAQLRATQNINKGSDRVKAETNRLARLNFGYRPSKKTSVAQPWSFPKEKRPAMDLLLEDIPDFSPPRGKPKKELPLSWAGADTLAQLDDMRIKVMGRGLSRNTAAKEVAAELKPPRNPEYYKTILNHFSQRMKLRL